MKKLNKMCAVFLSAALVITHFPAAMAEDNVPQDGSIASFEALDSSIANQTVTAGTALSGLNLPETVKAAIYHVTEEAAAPEENSMGDETVTAVSTSEEKIPVAWDSDPPYDGNTEGGYIFTADVGGYDLSPGVEPPTITVTVEGAGVTEDPEVIAITSFDELDKEVKHQTVEKGSPLESLNLPESLSAAGYNFASSTPPPRRSSLTA